MPQCCHVSGGDAYGENGGSQKWLCPRYGPYGRPAAASFQHPTAVPKHRVLRKLGQPLRAVWALTSSEPPWAVSDAQPDTLCHQRLHMTGTEPHAPRGAAGLGPNRNRGSCAGQAGGARRCTKRQRRPSAQPGPLAARVPVGRGSYAATHAHLGTDCRGTLWEPRAASGPEELRDSERTYASTHAYLGTACRGTHRRAIGPYSWAAELSMLDQILRPRKRANIVLSIAVPTKPSARTYYHAMCVHNCRVMQDDNWSYNQLVDGDEIVSMCLVDNDLVDGQLAYAAGGLPSKPHERMVSHPLLKHARYASPE